MYTFGVYFVILYSSLWQLLSSSFELLTLECYIRLTELISMAPTVDLLMEQISSAGVV